MAVVTIYRLAEAAKNLIEGGNPATASSIGWGELKIACGQVINQLLKTDYVSINIKTKEVIPNGAVLGLYEGITFTAYGTGKSKATLPIKPLKLPRNMGVWSIFPTSNPDKEFLPLQMGQASLLKSQTLINDLLGQVGYEVFGGEVVFTKDLTQMIPGETLSMRLMIMDISQYGDYDILPVPGEWEWQIITEVYKMYSTQPIPDKLIDPTVKENKNVPLKQQQQS